MKERIGDVTNPMKHARKELMQCWREVPVHTSTIALRFVTGADAFLSMCHDGDRAMIEMPMPGSTHFDKRLGGHDCLEPKELALYEAYNDGRLKLFRDTENAVREAFGARPHWGLNNSITGVQAAACMRGGRTGCSATGWRTASVSSTTR